MKTITFNLKEFEEWLSDMGSLELGIYGLVETDDDVEHTGGLPKGTVYHAYYGHRNELIKGEIKDEDDGYQEGYIQALEDYEESLLGRDIHEEKQNR